MPKIASVVSVMLLAVSAAAYPSKIAERSVPTGSDVVSYKIVDGNPISPMCIGLRLGNFCCVGICTMGNGPVESKVHAVSLIRERPENIVLQAEKGTNAVVTVNKSAGTFDVVSTSDPDATCIGIRIGGCCLGLCIL